MMRILSRGMTAILSMGLIGLLFVPLLYAEEYPADITRGKGVYERHCQTCHGVGGWGDGPDAQALKVPPANFHRFLSFLKSDEELLRTIEHGVVFSPMHSWRGQLTDGEMQDVVAYIRLLSQQPR
jgi:mono/diheme cytochrome c family protein